MNFKSLGNDAQVLMECWRKRKKKFAYGFRFIYATAFIRSERKRKLSLRNLARSLISHFASPVQVHFDLLFISLQNFLAMTSLDMLNMLQKNLFSFHSTYFHIIHDSLLSYATKGYKRTLLRPAP